MKIVQVFNGVVVEDLTFRYKSIKEAKASFPPYVVVVEVPDTTFPGYGYSNGEVTLPSVPEGQMLDPQTGTIYIPEQTQKTTRQSLYAEYDGAELGALRAIRNNEEVDKYTLRLTIIDTYKDAIHDTVNQEGYPLKVNYPPKPDLDTLTSVNEYLDILEEYYNG